jgi:hypothetical protein
MSFLPSAQYSIRRDAKLVILISTHAFHPAHLGSDIKTVQFSVAHMHKTGNEAYITDSGVQTSVVCVKT